jgi:hypothetical protein
VRDIVPPRQLNDDYFYTVGPTWPFGGSAQEGVTNWVVEGQLQAEPWSGLVARTDLNYYSGIGPPTEVRTFPNPELTTVIGTWATLATPTGTQVLVQRSDQSGVHLVSFNAATGQELGVAVQPTNIPNGAPDPPQFRRLLAAGDVNGDGYEDCFWISKSVNTWAYFGLLDGAVVWSQTDVGFTGFKFPYGRDLSGDGSPDAVVQEGDFLRGFSVKDGVELWVSSLDQLWTTAGPGEFIDAQSIPEGGFLFFHSLAATGNDHAVYPIGLNVPLGTMHDQHSGFGHFDAVDGTFLGAYYAPRNLKPWSQDLFSRRFVIPIGDYDRDGLTELYPRAPDPANTPPLFANMGQYRDRMIILGQRTLFVPDTHPFSTFYFQSWRYGDSIGPRPRKADLGNPRAGMLRRSWTSSTTLRARLRFLFPAASLCVLGRR